MPIYVNGGEAGKLYMMSDPPLQIGKVYRKDAGGSSLVYSGETALYDHGVINTELTGGFDTGKKTGGASVTFMNDRISLVASHDPNSYAWSRATVWTNQKVNLAGFSALSAEVASGQGAGWESGQFWILLSNNPIANDNPQINSCVTYVETLTAGVLTMNLNNYQGEYYVGICGTPNGSWYTGTNQYVYKLWLE